MADDNECSDCSGTGYKCDDCGKSSGDCLCDEGNEVECDSCGGSGEADE